MSRQFTRRRALATSVAALAGLSGCSLLSSLDSRTGTTIIAARVSSDIPESRRVSVLFERNSELVFWREFDVPAANQEAFGSVSIPVDSISDEPHVWTVGAFNHHTEEYVSVTLGTNVDPEIRIDINITADDDLEIFNST